MLNVLPRDEKYFDQFSELAKRIHESARILERFFVGESPVAAVADQVKRLEHECDEISHEILRGIDRSFITPIDREDIHQLAVRLDDVIDLIDGTARRLVLYDITSPTGPSKRLSQVIVAATSEMVVAVGALRKQKGVIEHCIRIKQLENEGDVAYHEAVASLFREKKADPIEVIKWKDVYENMEGCIDQCEAVAHVLESVVLKHS
jgi:predicted phosphate transport protein (TIGR00153 family)